MAKISVVMGVYNGVNRIEKAVHSILNQTFEDFELIICNDGSTDGSLEIINHLAETDHRIKVLNNSVNKGLAHTLNKCIKNSKGQYIARMDDDDLSHRDRLEKQLAFLENNPKYSILGTSRNLFGMTGIWGKEIIHGERTKEEVFMGKSFIHPSVLMRKDAIVKVGGYSEEKCIGRTEDYDLWCKLYSRGYMGFNLEDILIDYYEERDSYSKRKYKYRVAEFSLRKKWFKELGLARRYFIYIYRPLIVGILPKKILIYHHKNMFGR